MQHIGIDLGGRKSQVCWRDRHGKILSEGKYKNTELGALFEELPKSRVVMESCAEAFAIARQAKKAGHQVRVVPATLVKTLGVGARGVKTDKRDARVQSEASCRMDLPSIHVPSHDAQALRSMLTIRNLLVRNRTMVINSVRGYLRTHLIRVKGRGASKVFATRVRESLLAEKGEVPAAVERLLGLLEVIHTKVVEADKELQAYVKSHEICRLLMTAPYVGPVTAARFVAAIDDITRFDNAHHLEGYLGLTPGENSSSERVRRTGLTKAGCAPARACLVQCAWGILRMKDRDPIHDWGERIAVRQCKQVAACAIARKLAGILYAMWRDRRRYEPKLAARPVTA